MIHAMEFRRLPRTTLLLAAILPLLAAAGPTTEPAGEADSTPTIKVKRGSLPILIDGEGTFEPVDAVEIRIKPKSFTGDLEIKSIIESGTVVKAGDVLLELDDKPIKKDIAAAEEDLELARATYVKALSDSDLLQRADDLAKKIANEDVKNATDALKWFDDVDGPAMLQASELNVKQAKFSLEDQNDELDQLRKMYKTEDLTSATADIVIKRSLRQVELTKTAVQRAEDESRKVKAYTHPEARERLTFAVEQQTNNLNQLIANQTLESVRRKNALAKAKQAMADAEEKVGELKDDLKLFRQSAAGDGVAYLGQFASRAWSGNDPKTFRVGEKATASTTLITVIKPAKVRVAMDLPEAKFKAIKPAMNALVVPTITHRPIEGKTIIPSPIAKTGGLELDIELGDVDPAITPGMKASVFVDAGVADNVLIVPTKAVSDSKVWIKTTSDKPVSKRVIVGRSADEQTEIVDGLKEGDEILEQAQK